MVNILTDYIPPLSTLPNIAPFTYKDGETYLSTLEDLRTYVNTTLIDFVNSNFALLADETTTEINALIGSVNSQINAIINNSVTANDLLVKNIITDTTTLTRVLLDSLYAPLSEITGRLSDVSLVAEFAQKSTQTTVETGRLSDTSLLAEFAQKSTQTTVETGRLSDTSLLAEFAQKSTQVTVETGRLSATTIATTLSPINLIGTYATQPAANTVSAGTFYYATDTNNFYRSDGTTWVIVDTGGLINVLNTANRLALFPTPIQGNRIWRLDKGREETYYALYNITTNPAGKTIAGWYQTGGKPEAGTITFAANYGPYNGVLLTKNNGLVNLQFSSLKAGNAQIINGESIFSVPNNFYPLVDIADSLALGGAGYVSGRLQISRTTGNALVVLPSTMPAGATYTIDRVISYVSTDYPVLD